MPSSANLPWWSPHRPWGFRFSRADLIVVLVGVFATMFASQWSVDLPILIPFVLGHFFLFCNVFRVGERHELVWSGLFLVNVAVAATLTGSPWWTALPLQGLVTVVIVIRTLRSPDYHGLACQRINPLGYRPESRIARPSIIRGLLEQCRVPKSTIDLLIGRPRVDGE